MNLQEHLGKHPYGCLSQHVFWIAGLMRFPLSSLIIIFLYVKYLQNYHIIYIYLRKCIQLKKIEKCILNNPSYHFNWLHRVGPGRTQLDKNRYPPAKVKFFGLAKSTYQGSMCCISQLKCIDFIILALRFRLTNLNQHSRPCVNSSLWI